MSDLTTWLREEAEIDESGGCPDAAAKHREAADEIERLQAELDSAKALLDAALRDGVLAQAQAEIERLQTIITENLEYSADGVLLCNYDGPLYCPKCGSEVKQDYALCYCWNCTNPDGGDVAPLPLSYLSCLAKKGTK